MKKRKQRRTAKQKAASLRNIKRAQAAQRRRKPGAGKAGYRT